MYNTIEKIIKKIEGNVLSVCLDEKLVNVFNKNNKINVYTISSNANSGFFSKKEKKSKKKKNHKGKNINIKKLRKYLNKKSVNYLFCNMSEIYKYYKYFIKDSIYLCNNKVILYINDDIVDKELIINNYKRYTQNIEEKIYKDGYILEIDVSEAKNNFFKDKIYFIKDTFYNIAEFIGNLMIS